MILAADTNLVGEVFNIGGGSRITVNARIEEIQKLIGKRAKLKYIEKQKGDARDTWADVSKAKKDFGGCYTFMLTKERNWKNPFGDGRSEKKIVEILTKIV